MGPNTSALLSLTPLSGTGQGSQNSLQIASDSGENLSGEAGGMFAQLLSQLIPEQALEGAVLTENITILPTELTGEPGEPLPLTGNVLPLKLMPEESATVRLPETIEPVIADAQTDSAEAALVLAQTPLIPTIVQQTTTLTTTGSAQPAIVQTTTASLRNNRPQLTENALPQKPLLQITPQLNQPIDPEIVRTPVINVENIIAAEPTTPGTQHQLATAVTTDNPGMATTTTQLSSQPLAPTSTQHKLTLDHPIADARWGESLSQRVMYMTENGMGRAQIRLNPAELGPVDVRIAVANDEAKVAFTVQHGATREAIESALPRLREMFASQGIELSDATVSQHSPDEQQHAGDTSGSSKDSASHEFSATAFDQGDAVSEGRISISERLIDTYA